LTVDDAELERRVMARVLTVLKRRRGCIATPEMLRELSALATDAANAELGILGRADLGPLVSTVTVDQPPRVEEVILGVRLGVARVTLDRAVVALDLEPWPERL
jgi:hypothetical protein